MIVLPLEQPEQVRLTAVDEDHVFDILTDFHNLLPFLVHFALQIDDNLVDEFRRCKPIVKVIVEKVRESVNYLVEDFVDQLLLQLRLQLSVESITSEAFKDRETNKCTHIIHGIIV